MDDFKIIDDRGVPTLKALWHGVLIDCDTHDNRHLQLAGLEGHELLIELVEEEDEEYEERGTKEGEEEEDDDGIDYTGADADDGEEDPEECDGYPDDCEGCQELECSGPDAYPEDAEVLVTDFVLRIRQKPDGEWYECDDSWIEENPALCRFLNQINNTHGL